MLLHIHTPEESWVEELSSHLDAAYNLARWLIRNPHDAEDIVQEAYLRAFRHSTGCRVLNSRPWLLAIVRNCCYDFLNYNRRRNQDRAFDEMLHGTAGSAENPETALLREERVDVLGSAIQDLPVGYREVLILRELEELSYKEISDIVGVPLGTVMSRLSRARLQLQRTLVSP